LYHESATQHQRRIFEEEEARIEALAIEVAIDGNEVVIRGLIPSLSNLDLASKPFR